MGPLLFAKIQIPMTPLPIRIAPAMNPGIPTAMSSIDTAARKRKAKAMPAIPVMSERIDAARASFRNLF